MGVRGLWKVVEPTAKPVLLENMRGKILAIDASIWIYHFIKAMRDGKGELLRAAHLVGFFRRICKLLFYEIKPVFVFDGAAPILKKSTTKRRQQRRQDREETARATANRLLTLQLQRMAESSQGGPVPVKGSIPKDAHFLDQDKAPKVPKPFQSLDSYHLPEIESIAPVQINDNRLLTDDELNDYAEKFSAEARAGFIDSATIDFKSPEFKALPLATQYQLVNTARLKSRLRMGYTSEQLDAMFPDSMDFSKFQIQRVAQRNALTQRLMGLGGLEEDLTRRVSSEKNKHYMLKRNQEGWTLALENGEAPPMSLEHRDQSPIPKAVKAESDSDDFEDVDLDPDSAEESEEAEDMPAEGQSRRGSDADLNELFGFEASVQRQKVYNKPESPKSPEPSTKAMSETELTSKLAYNGSGAVSFLFSSSKGGSKPKKASPPQKEKKDAEPVELPPWFEQSTNTFESMPLTDRTEGNLVPIEMVERLRPDGEPASKLRRVSPGNQQDVFQERNPPSIDKAVPDRRPEAKKPAEKQEIPVVDLAEELEPPEPVDRTPVENPQFPVVDLAQEFGPSEPANKPASASVEVPKEPEPVVESVVTRNSDILTETAPEVERSDRGAENNSTGEGVLTEHDIMLAEADALAEEDEDQDLADMMIGEVQEHERFNKTLNVLTDGAAYRAEVETLREQFAHQKRDADNVTDDMIFECQELLQLFGIPYITAPMEAEAQCAELQALDLVDGIVTDDGDAFLFGDVVIYRNMFSMAKYVESYSSEVITDQLGLDRSRLIDLAFLLGSDYTDGVLGIGPVTGVELLAEFGSLPKFRDWWNRAQRDPNDENLSSTFKKQFYKKFKTKLFLSEDFPDGAVLDAYEHPVVDPDDTEFQWSALDLHGLKEFFARHAGWTPEYVNEQVIPVIEEAKRRELIRNSRQDQSNLDKWVVQNKHLRSKRAHKATDQLKRKL